MIIGIALILGGKPCTSLDAVLPVNLAAWSTPGTGFPDDLTKPVVMQAVDPAYLARIKEQPEQGAVAGLSELFRTHFFSRVDSFGATDLGFDIAEAGVYGIALDQRASVELRGPDATVRRPIVEEDGPACSSIETIVRFELDPGFYHLGVRDLTRPMVKVMLTERE